MTFGSSGAGFKQSRLQPQHFYINNVPRQPLLKRQSCCTRPYSECDPWLSLWAVPTPTPPYLHYQSGGELTNQPTNPEGINQQFRGEINQPTNKPINHCANSAHTYLGALFLSFGLLLSFLYLMCPVYPSPTVGSFCCLSTKVISVMFLVCTTQISLSLTVLLFLKSVLTRGKIPIP